MPTTELAYRVPYADTDRMGVVYYANYLIYFERLRTELLREHGLPYRRLEEEGLMLPVIEAHCQYRASAHYDDLLTITGRVAAIKGTRIRIECAVYRDELLLAEGYTVHACLNHIGRPIRVPDKLVALADRK
ncbi:MAG: thioesterase family protein [Victivallales bacterium]|nr:thioesterase family protein [Victivallales bacterium]